MDQDPTKETSLSEDYLSVMILMMWTTRVLFAGFFMSCGCNQMNQCKYSGKNKIFTQRCSFLRFFFYPRMLGYRGGRNTQRSFFGRVNNTFAMDNVYCVGNEDTILACPHIKVQENCVGSEGAGVICEGLTQRINHWSK